MMRERDDAAHAREIVWQLTAVLLSVVTSVVVGFIPSWTHVAFTVPQQTFLTILTLLVLMVLDLLWLMSKLVASQRLQHELWALEDEADMHLASIRSAFAKVAQHRIGEKDVFVHHLLYEMERLLAVANDAANKGELRVTGHHFARSELVVGAFGSDERVLRYTWRIDPTEQLFGDLHWRKYFELTAGLVSSGAIDEIRAVLVVEKHEHLNVARVQKLLEFFATHDGLTAKTVLKADYELLGTDNEISADCLEFGIYGNRLLYQSHGDTPSSVGTWSKDPTTIKRFRVFFDTLWETETIASNNPASVATLIALTDLIAADQICENGS